jgi:hypothetical protein
MGITAGIGTGIGGISSLVYTYQKLSTEFNDTEWVSQSIEALQDQVHSLTSAVLQSRSTFHLLNVEKGRTCLFLREECCFYTNKSGVVRDMAQQLKERITRRRQELTNLWSFWSKIWSWAPWALPLAGPLFNAPSNTPIWALYNKCSFQVYISTCTKGKIPAPS